MKKLWKGGAMNKVTHEREVLIHDFFPEGVPKLWCPVLTHFRDDGGIDFERMSAHFHSISPWIRGLLIPGTTGEGWELDDRETMQVTEFALGLARKYGTRLLLGVLRTDIEAVKRIISDMITLIPHGEGTTPRMTESLRAAGVCGFAVCPPKGRSLSQTEIEAGLVVIMEMGLPIALYQLPYITENEVAPETFEKFVKRYPHLIFFKDSSGRDLIALSKVDKTGVFLVRGGEGDYIKWLKDAGGPYDGFLLSVTNVFSPALSSMIKYLENGDLQNARDLSEKVSKALFKVIGCVRQLPYGNPFTNANKAIDHFFAFGPAAAAKEGPLLKTGVRLPKEVLVETGAMLDAFGLMPGKGYLE
jgi:4-hydroxy-tetrahydrodipicolinate synthase